MTYSVVEYAAIGTNFAESTSLVLFTGRCLVTAGYYDSTILSLSEYATLSFVFKGLLVLKMTRFVEASSPTFRQN
jgi:hypothetical protein